MSALVEPVHVARKPWSKHKKKQTLVAIAYFGSLLIIGKFILFMGTLISAIHLTSDGEIIFRGVNLSMVDLNTGTMDLIEDDWEPWNSQKFLGCERRNGQDEYQAESVSEWFPYIEKVKRDGFIIISNTNCGYLDFALNFWEHYQRLGYTNIVFIAEDCIAYNVLKSRIGKHHVAPPILQREKTYEDEIFSEIFRNMTLLRPKYLHYFLNRGVSVMWQDIDSVPIRNTMEFFPRGYDIVAVDDYVTDGHYSSNYLCACLLLLNPTHHTFNLLNVWMSEIESNLSNASDNDQLALNRALSKLRNNREITLAILPRTVYPNGHDYDSFALTAAWVHANYLIGGNSKRDFLKRRGFWVSMEHNYHC